MTNTTSFGLVHATSENVAWIDLRDGSNGLPYHFCPVSLYSGPITEPALFHKALLRAMQFSDAALAWACE